MTRRRASVLPRQGIELIALLAATGLAGCVSAPGPTRVNGEGTPGTLPSTGSSLVGPAALARGGVVLESGAPNAAWSPDGERLLVRELKTGTITVYDGNGARLSDVQGTNAEWIGNRSLLVWTASGVFSEPIDGGPATPAPRDISPDAVVSPDGLVAYPIGPLGSSTSFKVWDGATTSAARPGVPRTWSADGSTLVTWQPTTSTGALELLGHVELLSGPGLGRVLVFPTLTGLQAPELDASGAHLAFLAGRLQVLDVESGVVTPVSQGETASDSFAWGPDGRLYYASASGRIVSVSATGGQPIDVATGDAVASSSDGTMVACYVADSTGDLTVHVLSGSPTAATTIQAPGPIEPTLSVAPNGHALVLIADSKAILYRLGR